LPRFFASDSTTAGADFVQHGPNPGKVIPFRTIYRQICGEIEVLNPQGCLIESGKWHETGGD
jgi:hypothetical protein